MLTVMFLPARWKSWHHISRMNVVGANNTGWSRPVKLHVSRSGSCGFRSNENGT